jgi:hypothetical protein
MEQLFATDVAHIDEFVASHDLSRLILKLRWIGLEDEAQKLQVALDTLRPEARGTVSFGPFGTD